MKERETLAPQVHIGLRPTKRKADRQAAKTKPPPDIKPWGALWTSTFDTAWEIGWPWWLEQEGYDYQWRAKGSDHEHHGWLLRPRECDVWTVSGLTDAVAFMDRFGVDRSDFKFIDWQAVAEDVSAVRLTAPYDPDLRYGLLSGIGLTWYAWDCESTAWFNWEFESVKQIDLPPLKARDTYDDEVEVI